MGEKMKQKTYIGLKHINIVRGILIVVLILEKSIYMEIIRNIITMTYLLRSMMLHITNGESIGECLKYGKLVN